MSRYSVFLNIQFEHEYYAENLNNSISVSPSSGSTELLKHAGLLGKYDNGRFSLFGNEKSTDYLLAYLADWLENAPDDASEPTLMFMLRAIDAYLYNATENMPTPNNHYWFVSNCTMHENTPNALFDSVSLDQSQHLPWSESKRASVSEEARDISSIIALVEVSLFKLLDALSAQTFLDFRIKIAARKTYWQYWFYSQHEAVLTLQIQDLGGEVSFIQDGNKTFNNQEFTGFISDRLISLRQDPQQHFQLNLIKNNEQHLVINQLPSASAQTVQVKRVNSELTLVSEMFIYL
jgi:hypothetical protein